jgi:hypothetical protein
MLELLTKARDIEAAARGDSQYGESEKLQARLLRLFCETNVLSRRHSELYGSLAQLMAIGAPIDRKKAEEESKAIYEGWAQWEREIDEVVKAARASANPFVLGDAIHADALGRINFLHSKFFAARQLGIENTIDRGVLVPVIARLDSASDLFRRLGCRERYLKSQLAKADLLDLLDRPEEAKAIGKSVLPEAQAFGMPEIVAHALEVVQGSTLFRQVLAVADALDADEDPCSPSSPTMASARTRTIF